MKIRFVHFLYYKILVHLIPLKKSTDPIIRNQYRLHCKYILAKLFNAKRCTAGDSNDAVADNYETMRYYDDMLTICFGQGGSTAFQWVKFLQHNKIGQKIAKLFEKKILIWNIGGNHSIMNDMGTAEDSLYMLRLMFPYSYNCTIPEILEKKLASALATGKTAEQYKAEMLQINDWIRQIWKKRCIDLYNIFLNHETMETYVYMMGDAVHWSKFAAKVIREYKEVIT